MAQKKRKGTSRVSRGEADHRDAGGDAEATGAHKAARPGDKGAGPPRRDRFPIVGLGSSAGGLDALDHFFEHMPADAGMAFVVISHQHKGQRSLLAELLGRKTSMPVAEVSKATKAEPNHVYTVEPGRYLGIMSGVLHPVLPAGHGELSRPELPIDHFFRSLAQDQQDRAIAIVLSGTGSDGTLGIKEVKGALGMVMVQDEASAQYTGMPHSAIATAMVDYVLPVEEMPEHLLAYGRSLRSEGPRDRIVVPADEVLQQILLTLRSRGGHDFSQYKTSTVLRRIERRMNVHHIADMGEYVRHLRDDPVEAGLLFRELLIGVTSFFRDAEAFEALSRGIRALIRDRPVGHVLRAWVPGCSTGEEAYSIAIVIAEAMTAAGRPIDVQIFATDLDGIAIDVARQGIYPVGIASDVTVERLTRYFTQHEDSYRVNKDIREMVIFAPQNVITDPPFTRLDLLSCRNLLIYLNAEVQKKLLPVFHYALRPDGLLLLGSSESIGTFGRLFDAVDKKWRLFRRKEVPAGTYVADLPSGAPEATAAVQSDLSGARGHGAVDVGRLAERVMLRELVPPSVLVHERGDVVHIHGRTGRFLEPAPGSQAAANIFNMAREGLEVDLAGAMRTAVDGDREVVRRGVRLRSNGGFLLVDLRVRCVHEPEALRGLLLVSFEQPRPLEEGVKGPPTEGELSADAETRTEQLERELRHIRESHQATVEALQTANEDLKSANEELQSMNEELQSTNEELETSKEEMQSLNEELLTVNAELRTKVDELSRAHDDMNNLLNGTDIATVFLDDALRIKRYTEKAKNVIPLIPSDLGRFIGDLVSSLHYHRLVDDANEVLRTLASKETAVQDAEGRSYLLRIVPYRTMEKVIDGLVLTFVDITNITRIRADQKRLLDALEHSPTIVFGQDPDGRFVWTSSPLFGRSAEELVGRAPEEVLRGEEAAGFAAVREEALRTGAAVRRRLRLQVDGAARNYDLFVEPVPENEGDRGGSLSCVLSDVAEEGGGRD